jgi:hypothetical protein
MKKLFLIAVLFTALSAKAQTIVKYPFGAADFSTLTVDNDTLYATVNNSVTYLTLSDTLVGNTVMYATISSKVKAGDKLYIRSLNGATARTITWKSTYFKAANTTTTANKTKVYSFVYDGSVFVIVGTQQID